MFSPNGDRIVTNGLNEDPKVHSPHHRGIFYGFNRITYATARRQIPGTASTERFSSTNVFSRQRNAPFWVGTVFTSGDLTPPSRLAIGAGDGKVTITYGGTLQSSENVASGYTDVAGATSPYATPHTDKARFYRSRQ